MEKSSWKPKIFIGSNNLAFGMVQWLAKELNSLDLAIPEEIGSIDTTDNTLVTIHDKCNECDFAVLFLTKDVEKNVPRQNALFEAGFFAGRLGLEPKRCILVTSIQESSLPLAIDDITLITIDEPPSPEPPFFKISDEWCTLNLQEVIKEISNAIKKYGELLYRPYLKILTKEQLAEREQIGDDCLQNYGKVVITTEINDNCDYYLARFAAQNLKSDIDYDYVISTIEGYEQNTCSKVIYMLRILAAAYYRDFSEEDLQDETKIMDVLKTKSAENSSAMLASYKNHLRFSFQKVTQQIPFRMTLHNAHNSSKTKCYLRHGNNYVEWFVKNDIGDTSGPSFPNYRSPDNQKVIQNSPSVVFYNPESKKVNDSIELGKNMNRLLCQNIKKMFPDTMADEIVKLCFGSNQ